MSITSRLSKLEEAANRRPPEDPPEMSDDELHDELVKRFGHVPTLEEARAMLAETAAADAPDAPQTAQNGV
jgi:hypothetical protein